MTIPAFSASVDIVCLFIYSTIKVIRYRSRKKEHYTLYRDAFFGLIVVICILDIVICLIVFEEQLIANILRPLVVVLMYRTQQDFFMLVALNIKDSFAMLCCLLIWVLYFAAIGTFLFEN